MKTAPMPRIVGATIQARRQMLGWTQQDLGKELAPYLGDAWSPSLVSQAENGRRQFQLTELVALAHVLKLRLYTLLLIDPEQWDGVDFIDPEDRERVLNTLTVDQLQPRGDLPNIDSAAEQIAQARTLVSDTARDTGALSEALLEAIGKLGEAHGMAERAADEAQDADWLITKLHRDVGKFARGTITTETDPNAIPGLED